MRSSVYVISTKNYEKVLNTQGAFIERLSKLPKKEITDDLLNFAKPREQLKILTQYIPDHNLRHKKLLEIGSGLGILQLIARKEFNIDAWGVESDSEGFEGALEISRSILSDNGLLTNQILYARGEDMPFESNFFHVVFSTNVLEHVTNPMQVIREAIRVCTVGGVIQMVVPNFGSFFDGHYACFYIPYQPKTIWKWYLKYILRRNPSFVDTLQTTINYFSIKRALRPYLADGKIQIVTLGEEIFKYRMETLDFSPWGGLKKVERWITCIHSLHIEKPIAKILILCKAFDPLIITIRKLK